MLFGKYKQTGLRRSNRDMAGLIVEIKSKNLDETILPKVSPCSILKSRTDQKNLMRGGDSFGGTTDAY
jgi:hypothetical protein